MSDAPPTPLPTIPPPPPPRPRPTSPAQLVPVANGWILIVDQTPLAVALDAAQVGTVAADWARGVYRP